MIGQGWVGWVLAREGGRLNHSPPSCLPLSYLRAAKFRPSARLVVFVYVFVVRPSVTKLDANVSAKGKPSLNGWGRKNRLSSCTHSSRCTGPKATTNTTGAKVGGEEEGGEWGGSNEKPLEDNSLLTTSTFGRLVKFLRQRFRWQINSSLPPLLEEGSLTNNTVKKEERKENYSLVSPCEKKRKKREEGNVHALPYACVRSL